MPFLERYEGSRTEGASSIAFSDIYRHHNIVMRCSGRSVSVPLRSRSYRGTKSFVELVVMPSILASIEYVTTAIRSRREGISWIIEVVFGSSLRLSSFVFPIAIIVGWVVGESVMDMVLDGFQVCVLCLITLLINHVILNGIVHWRVQRSEDR